MQNHFSRSLSPIPYLDVGEKILIRSYYGPAKAQCVKWGTKLRRKYSCESVLIDDRIYCKVKRLYRDTDPLHRVFFCQPGTVIQLSDPAAWEHQWRPPGMRQNPKFRSIFAEPIDDGQLRDANGVLAPGWHPKPPAKPVAKKPRRRRITRKPPAKPVADLTVKLAPNGKPRLRDAERMIAPEWARLSARILKKSEEHSRLRASMAANSVSLRSGAS